MKSRGIRWGMCVGFLLCFAVPCLGGETDETDASEKKSPCLACHETVTPGIVRQFLDSKMAETMDCSDCHGAGHTTRDDVIQAKLPTPDTCADCHEVHVMQYRTGKHALAWSAMQALPMVRHQPIAIAGDEASKGCPECHEIGDKPIGEMKRYGTGPCDSCHTRHSFSLKEARDPRVCRSCHMGSDHRQWEMWSTSKHGTIWEIDPASGRAPTCQNCHMPDGHHGVVTAWGFLALRLPEEDKEWLADRVTILQALGILDDAGNPTERFDGVKATKLMRLNKEEFDIQRGKMLDICASCHSPNYALEQLQAGDRIIRETDGLFAAAIRTVKALYTAGILKKPEDWKFAPDLLQFYEGKTVAEQELYRIFMVYRMRTFQGAFHSNPNHMYWGGWAEVRQASIRIEEDAARLRLNAADTVKH